MYSLTALTALRRNASYRHKLKTRARLSSLFLHVVFQLVLKTPFAPPPPSGYRISKDATVCNYDMWIFQLLPDMSLQSAAHAVSSALDIARSVVDHTRLELHRHFWLGLFEKSDRRLACHIVRTHISLHRPARYIKHAYTVLHLMAGCRPTPDVSNHHHHLRRRRSSTEP